MNFTWLNKQGVRSDRGFEVQRVDRDTMEYREGGRKITVVWEFGTPDGEKPAILIGPDAFDRWDDGKENSFEERMRILENFREALEFKGLGLSVE